MITIITGQGRCGSSLIMQMLAAAGLPVVGSPSFYEDERSSISKFDPDWLVSLDGKYVKVLGVQHLKLKPADYRFIFLKRNPSEQAMSQNKFQTIVNRGKAESYEGMKWQVRRQNKLCLKKCKSLGETLEMRFEHLIDYPELQIGRLCMFLNLRPLRDYGHLMISRIVSRETKCLPTMEIEQVLSERY